LFIKAFGDLDQLDTEVSELYIYPPDGMHFRRVMMHEVKKIFLIKENYFEGFESLSYLWIYKRERSNCWLEVFRCSFGCPGRMVKDKKKLLYVY